MRIKLTALLSVLVFLGLASLEAVAADNDVDAGRKLAMDKKMGNCIACHAIPSDPKVEAAGNIGPPFVAMKERFPDRAKLRAQIWDSTAAKPDSVMPPFGRNKILTEQQIDQVTDYIETIK
jgi:L-cysteine S-thiosulfotransferase